MKMLDRERERPDLKRSEAERARGRGAVADAMVRDWSRTNTLSCGHRSWSHGPGRIGSYQTCYPALDGLYPLERVFGCQTSRKVVAVERGLKVG